MSKYEMGRYETQLAKLLKTIIKDKDDFVGIMLSLTIDLSTSEMNCKQLINYIQNNPSAEYEEILEKTDEILGIEDPFGDEEEFN